MPLDSYLGIGKPEEKREIDIKRNPVDILNSAYSLWCGFIKQRAPCQAPGWQEHISTLDSLLKEAESILNPYDKNIPAIVKGEEYFSFMDVIRNKIRFELPHIVQYFLPGLFYTALLHLETERTIIIPKNIALPALGYKLQKGSIINYGDMPEKRYSTALGSHAIGGLIVNRGVIGGIGTEAHGGVFLNLGCVNDVLGRNSQEGYFICSHICKWYHHRYDHLVNVKRTLQRHVTVQEKALLPFFTDLKIAAHHEDVLHIKNIVNNIKQYCTRYYAH